MANLHSIHVGGIPFSSSVQDLRDIFGKYGEVADVYIPRDSVTKEPRGFCFVRYYDEGAASDAIAKAFSFVGSVPS